MAEDGEAGACPVCGRTEHAPFGAKNGYRLRSCGRCEALFVAPMPEPAELANFYERYHKTGQYAAKLASKVRRARRRIRRIRRLAPGRRFIDVGCNVGFAVAAARACGFEAHGVDIDGAAIATARATFPECRFEQRDVAEVEGPFDLAYCSEVIEHVPQPVAFLGAVRDALAPGGLLYLTTPDMAHRSLPRAVSELLATEAIRPPEHLLYLHRGSTRALLERCGFADVRFLLGGKATLRAVAWRDGRPARFSASRRRRRRSAPRR